MKTLSLLVFVTAAAGAAAIYPDDHFNYSTMLDTQDKFDAHVKEVVEAGKTLFVRTIASKG
jgi:hypothetical protein